MAEVCKRIILNSDEDLPINGIKQIGAEYIDSLLKDNVLEVDSPLMKQLCNSRIGKDIKIYCGIIIQILVPDDSGIKKHVDFKLDTDIIKRFVFGI